MCLCEIKRFVRRELGCSCPDEVFDNIEVLDAQREFAGLPGDYVIGIGHRLLILVINAQSWQKVAAALEQLCARGRDMRDVQGFRRFRLVVVTPDTELARRVLAGLFDTFTDTDDRAHLHVIAPQGLPPLGVGRRQ